MSFKTLFIAIVSFSITASAQYLNKADAVTSELENTFILNYLKRISAEVTEQCVADINSLDDWLGMRDQKYHEFVEMMSLVDVPLAGERPPLNVVYVDTLQMDGYRIEKLYYESLPQLYVVANLYVPDGITDPAPAVLYTCGHAETQKVYYQAHPRKFAQLGFVCLIIETIQYGEVWGHHQGAFNQDWYHWYSRGYCPGGVEAWNGIRGIDLLCNRQEVDTARIGVTGNSGGGTQSWYIPALDLRVKASASSCGTGLLETQVSSRTISAHCDCMMPINTYLIDFPNIGALIAPRPFMIVSATEDRLYKIDAARQCYEYTNKIYEYYGAEESLYFVEKPIGHGYSEETRPLIFQFFVRHLMNKQMTLEEIGDIDEFELSDEELRVFVDGPPADDMTTEIKDAFVKQAEIPHIQDIGTLEAHRSAVKQQLAEKTFRAFPADTPEADTALVLHSADGNSPDTTVFTFTSEQDWILKVDIRWRNPVEQNSPMMLVVRNAYQDKSVAEEFMAGLHPRWNIAYLDVRGVGDTEWKSFLEWYVRRSLAWTGRTLASTRVYDVLRCLQILRNMDGIDPDRIGIAAADELTAVALYAAFMDGNVPVTLLKSPPATQDAPDDSIGAGLEMLNVLRFTDLPPVAGMLFPAEIVIVDEMPQAFSWAQSLYYTLGKPELFQHVETVAQWQPVTAVKNDPPEKPVTFHFYQNYPNPFNAGTKITYHLSAAGNVSLKIYNICGEEIRTLIDERQNSGNHTTSWNGKNDQGNPVSSGLYICKLKSADHVRSVKMVVLR